MFPLGISVHFGGLTKAEAMLQLGTRTRHSSAAHNGHFLVKCIVFSPMIGPAAGLASIGCSSKKATRILSMICIDIFLEGSKTARYVG
jgi:hypothetical protein